MERIASFTVNHLILTQGIYLSRVDGDVDTYDLRLCRPNAGTYLENAAMHTIEHLFATYVRNSAFRDHIIYFGPMGCRTGFYFLVRGIDGATVIDLTRQAFEFIADFEGEIPGTTAIECGNYLEHDLAGAKQVAREYLEIIADYTVEGLAYRQ